MTDLQREWGTRIQVMIVHQAFRPFNKSDNIEHAEGVHVALSSTAWYRNQKEGQQLIVHLKTYVQSTCPS